MDSYSHLKSHMYMPPPPPPSTFSPDKKLNAPSLKYDQRQPVLGPQSPKSEPYEYREEKRKKEYASVCKVPSKGCLMWWWWWCKWQ